MTDTIDSKVDNAPKIPKTFEEKKRMYSKVIENRCIEANYKYDSKTIEKAAEDLANGNYKTPHLDGFIFER